MKGKSILDAPGGHRLDSGPDPTSYSHMVFTFGFKDQPISSCLGDPHASLYKAV